MRATTILLKQTLRLTLFTRPNCSLCDDAKGVLSKVWDHRPFEYDEVNVMKSGQGKWKAVYEFDTPVVHVDATEENNPNFQTTNSARKLMHRFSEQQVESTMDEAMKYSG